MSPSRIAFALCLLLALGSGCATTLTAVGYPSGLFIRPAKRGMGPSPGPRATVTIHYVGRLPDGTVFDSSHGRGQPATFQLASLIPCWQEGIQRMHVGGSATLICPPQLAYGERGAPPTIPPNATLEFDVWLIKVGPRTNAP